MRVIVDCRFLAGLLATIFLAETSVAQLAVAGPQATSDGPVAAIDLDASIPAPTAKQLEYAQFALTHTGDADRGRKLYLDAKLTKCAICHKIEQHGGEAGPDLTIIGGKFDRPHLIESLIEPSRQIVEDFRTSTIVTRDGRVRTGVVRQQLEGNFTLFDVAGKKHVIAQADIEERNVNSLSLMPQGLSDVLTPQQFTDLIAYLETLRSNERPKNGAGIVGPISLPPGFEIQTVTTGLTGCTALETLPDGRILLCEQTGTLRVIKQGRLLEDPFVTLDVDNNWERGLIGVTIHPDFPETPYVYLCYVSGDPYPHHRISRFTADGDIAVPGSEKILLRGDDQRTLGGKVPAGHQGGALHFGNDGTLYIGIGEQTAGMPSQSLGTFQGKILRIADDGTIPADNPFLDETTGKYRAIWARGLRNPFTFAVHKPSGDLFINDVGGKFEEINRGVAGANYGWPVVEHGPTEQEGYHGPEHWYPQASIAGGDFVAANSDWPDSFRNHYLFADFNHGWIKSMDPNHPSDVETFAGGLRRPVDLRIAPDGSLYVLLRNAWVIDGKFQGSTGSLMRISYTGNKAVSELQPKLESGVRLTENAVDESAGNLPAYKIETPNAVYYLEKSGAGLSSLIDRDGNDWLGFHPQSKSGAAGEYRGFPNAVHRQSGSYFHPKNDGTDPARTNVEYADDDRVVISAQSESGHWACRYEFFSTHCTFTMTRMPAGYKYWALYEGTPGGQFDNSDWWMTSQSPQRHPMHENHEGDIAGPEWIAFGDQNRNRSLMLLHHEDDAHPDRFYQMQEKMTVFGFGRKGIDKFLDSVPQSISIGLVESTDHAAVNSAAATILADSRGRD